MSATPAAARSAPAARRKQKKIINFCYNSNRKFSITAKIKIKMYYSGSYEHFLFFIQAAISATRSAPAARRRRGRPFKHYIYIYIYILYNYIY